MESMDEKRSGINHRAAHHQSADDPPEKNAVLMLLGDSEIREDQDDDEDVVDRERVLDDVAGEELECCLVTTP